MGTMLVLALSALAGSAGDTLVETVPYSPPSAALAVDVYRVPHKRGASIQPIVVFLHGGVWQSGDRRQYAHVGEAMAQQGFVGVVASYRLAPAARWPAQIEDAAGVVALVKARASSWGGDPARIVLAGHSAGGQLATLLLHDPRWLKVHGLVPEDIAGVVAISGVFDLRAPLDEGQHDGGFARFVAPVFGRDTETLRAASPLDVIRPTGVPLLLITATGDYAAMRDQTDAFARALALRGHPAPVVVVPQRDHFGLVTEIGEPGDQTTAEIVSFVRRAAKAASAATP